MQALDGEWRGKGVLLVPADYDEVKLGRAGASVVVPDDRAGQSNPFTPNAPARDVTVGITAATLAFGSASLTIMLLNTPTAASLRHHRPD